MEVAKNLSEDNLKTKKGGPFGACIVKDDKIIGRGSNNVLINNDPTAHAEVMAIRDACKNINSYDFTKILYILKIAKYLWILLWFCIKIILKLLMTF